jgi:hypothetical protein
VHRRERGEREARQERYEENGWERRVSTESKPGGVHMLTDGPRIYPTISILRKVHPVFVLKVHLVYMPKVHLVYMPKMHFVYMPKATSAIQSTLKYYLTLQNTMIGRMR